KGFSLDLPELWPDANRNRFRTLRPHQTSEMDWLEPPEVASAKRKNYNQSPEYVNRLLSACHSKMRSSYSSKVESSCSKPANWLDERTGGAGVKHQGSGSAEGFACSKGQAFDAAGGGAAVGDQRSLGEKAAGAGEAGRRPGSRAIGGGGVGRTGACRKACAPKR